MKTAWALWSHTAKAWVARDGSYVDKCQEAKAVKGPEALRMVSEFPGSIEAILVRVEYPADH